jgi:imidazolonepropionase
MEMWIVHHADQLLTLAGGPQRGYALGDLGLIEQGAVVMQGAPDPGCWAQR